MKPIMYKIEMYKVGRIIQQGVHDIVHTNVWSDIPRNVIDDVIEMNLSFLNVIRSHVLRDFYERPPSHVFETGRTKDLREEHQ